MTLTKEMDLALFLNAFPSNATDERRNCPTTQKVLKATPTFNNNFNFTCQCCYWECPSTSREKVGVIKRAQIALNANYGASLPG
jgi:hypothetical protein